MLAVALLTEGYENTAHVPRKVPGSVTPGHLHNYDQIILILATVYNSAVNLLTTLIWVYHRMLPVSQLQLVVSTELSI